MKHPSLTRQAAPSFEPRYLGLILLLFLQGCLAGSHRSPPHPSEAYPALQPEDRPLAVLTAGSALVERANDPEARITGFSPMLLRSGDSVAPSGGDPISLICRGDRFLRWKTRRILTPEACLEGLSLSPGSFELVRPRGGRLQTVEGIFEIPPDTRELPGDYGQVPVVARPRKTKILESKPTVTFTSVDGAIAYHIDWLGPEGPFFSVPIAALHCERSQEFPAVSSLCSFHWPLDKPGLIPGGSYQLTVTAKLEYEEKPRLSDEHNRVRVVSSNVAQQLRMQAEPRGLGLDRTTTLRLEAATYSRSGLYSNAIDAYRKLAARVPSSAMPLVTLGDFYRKVHLYSPAEHFYELAKRVAVGLKERASAEFGLGQVRYAWKHFTQAIYHLGYAEQLYQGANLLQERNAARKVREAAQARSGR